MDKDTKNQETQPATWSATDGRGFKTPPVPSAWLFLFSVAFNTGLLFWFVLFAFSFQFSFFVLSDWLQTQTPFCLMALFLIFVLNRTEDDDKQTTTLQATLFLFLKRRFYEYIWGLKCSCRGLDLPWQGCPAYYTTGWIARLRCLHSIRFAF